MSFSRSRIYANGVYYVVRRRWMTVVETGPFGVMARRCMAPAELDAAIQMIARDPACGDVLVGTGGIRKVRFAVKGRGKSGGVRVVYYYHNEALPVFMLAVFAKNEKANLSAAERSELGRLVRTLVATYGEKQ